VASGDFAEHLTTEGIEHSSDRHPPYHRQYHAGGDPDRQGVSHPLCHLLPGGGLRHA
jgi:hypothetical protein